jgi:N-acetylneuraminic acid mutarotase
MWTLRLGALFFAGVELFGVKGPKKQLAWTERAELPRPVAGYMAGVSHGNLLIVGGTYWEHGEKQWTNQVQIFHEQKNSWTTGPSLPQPRSDAASVVINNRVYVFGGGEGDVVRRDCLVLEEGAWKSLPEAELPGPRLYANAAIDGGWVYLLGGMSDAHDYTTASNEFWRWRPRERGWQELPPLPGPGRINFAMAQIGGYVYVFGGATAAGAADVRNLDDAYRFDPAKRKWERLHDLPVANRSWWSVTLGNSALVLAGYTNTYADAVYRYLPQCGLQRVGTLPHALADPKFFVIKNVIVGTGGEAGAAVRGKWTLQATLPQSWLIGNRLL